MAQPDVLVSASLTAQEVAATRASGAELRAATHRLRLNAVFIGVLAVGSYLGLLAVDHLLLGIPLALTFAVASIAIGTSVMHDANHGTFSRSTRLNHLIGFSADLLGASSWLWRQKHNGLHHANTNVQGLDTDIEQTPFARLAPSQPWKPWYRFQHVYMWVLYGFLTLQWVVAADFGNLATRRIGSQPMRRRPTRGDLVRLFLGKALHVGWAVILPLQFHRWWVVAVFYLAISWLVGFALSVIFQLAHCVDNTEFFTPDTPRRGDDFVLHQLRTTANVECGRGAGRAVSWMMGGLDHQIEHHLAPGSPHTSYRQMSERLRALCVERGIEYRVHPSIGAALRSHARWLHTMGRPTAG